MHKKKILIFSTLILMVFLFVNSCEKERIVESTEYIQNTEYIQLPPDTVIYIDSIFINDSVIVNNSDTVMVYVHDTVFQTNNNYDTVIIHDTVTTVTHHYDTINTVDTVLTIQNNPNEYLAITALEYYNDPLVLEFTNQEFGLNDGWILYLSAFQLDLTSQSSDVYDIYGYIDYWAPDWSGYYQFEFYWRVTFTGGDPTNVSNWQMTEPPTGASLHTPGIKSSGEFNISKPVLK